jgi:hypothetical protein
MRLAFFIKNKAFCRFLIALVLLIAGWLSLFIPHFVAGFLFVICFIASFGYASFSMIDGINQLRLREGKKYLNLIAIIGDGVIISVFVMFFKDFISMV